MMLFLSGSIWHKHAHANADIEPASLQIEMTRGPQSKININLNQFISIPNIFKSRKSTSYIRQYPGTSQVLQNELIITTPAIQRRSKLHPCNPQWLGARLSHPARLRPVEAAPAPARPSRAINKAYAIPVKRNETSHS